MSETEVWLRIIRVATEAEISSIESAKTLDLLDLHQFAVECLLSLIVDLKRYKRLERFADEAGELNKELTEKMWQAVDTRRDRMALVFSVDREKIFRWRDRNE